MQSSENSEIWQVEVAGQVYEATFGELPEWIDEGSLQPEDKIRKGNLRWIEARKVPALIPFFNARANGQPLPVITTVDASPEVTEGAPGLENPVPVLVNTTQSNAARTVFSDAAATMPAVSVNAVPGCCSVHPSVPAMYVCTSCSTEFCKVCPRSYGGDVRICPECESLCTTAKKAAEANRRSVAESSFGNEPFGFTDFGRAFAHPFRFKPSLVFGGLMFMFFTLGQAVAGIGGMLFIVAAIFCTMLANMLTFGVLANTVENFSQGRLDADFMPSFEDFSLWDDVIHPFFLSIGVYISSFGAFILVVVVGVYLIVSAAGEQMKKYNEELTRVPGTQFYTPDRTMEQSQQVKDILERVKQQNAKRMARQQGLMRAAESGEPLPDDPAGSFTDPDADAAEFERIVADAKPKQLEIAGTGGDQSATRMRDAVGSILKLAAPLVVLGGLALLWGLFYFPAACAVAGYSRSFFATINPLVGLDTIKRLGGTYALILVMGFLLLIAAGVASIAIQIVLMPFYLPGLGNLPATAVGSFVTFYFSIVFSCLLGYALFKSADRLKLYR